MFFYNLLTRHLLLLLCVLLSYSIRAQVGIGTTSPEATLDVTGRPADTAVLDGVIPPRITGDQLQAKTYTAAQNGTLVYVTAPSSGPAGQTVNVTREGMYAFSSSNNRWDILNNPNDLSSIGSRQTVYRDVTITGPSGIHLNPAGLIEIDNTIRVTMQLANTSFGYPRLQNISGGDISLTTTSLIYGTPDSRSGSINNDAVLANNAYLNVAPNSNSQNLGWGFSPTTLIVDVILTNGRLYRISWVVSRFSTAESNRKRIYMSAERLF